jgi:hypothetical protein
MIYHLTLISRAAAKQWNKIKQNKETSIIGKAVRNLEVLFTIDINVK